MKKKMVWSEPELVMLNSHDRDVAIGVCVDGSSPSIDPSECTRGGSASFICGVGAAGPGGG